MQVGAGQGDYKWTTTTTNNSSGQVTTDTKSAIRVLSPESITGDPRDVTKHGDNAANGSEHLNNDFTADKQKEIVDGAIASIHGYSDIAKQSDHGSLDFYSLFNYGELINMNGIYMNNHEALNYMWGEAMSAINSSGKTTFGVSVNWALEGAELYSNYDYFHGGGSKPFSNEDNHNEAIVRGYLNNSLGTSNDAARDQMVFHYIYPITRGD